MPPRGETVNQLADGRLTVQPRPSPPVLVIVMLCEAGLLPCIASKDRLVGLTCIAGAATLMVIDTIVPLPFVGLPVDGSTALTVTLVVYVWPPITPVAFTMTSVEVLVPPARFEPELAESETKDSPPWGRAALQFKGWPPELPIVIGCDDVPVVTLNVSEVGLTVRIGGAVMFSVITMVCDVPTALPVTLSVALMVTVPV